MKQHSKLEERIGKDYIQSGVYLLMISDHFYVGSSKNIKERISTHRTELRNNRHFNKFVQNSYNKYGVENCSWKVLEFCKQGDLLVREKYYIDLLGPDMNLKLDPVTQNNVVSLSRKINQFNLSGDLVTTFPSCAEATRVTGITGIVHAANKYKSYKSVGGFMWSYENKVVPYQNNSRMAKVKSVTAYDISGKKVKTYESIADCYRNLFPSMSLDGTCAMISCAASGRSCSFQGYRFSYENVDKLDNSILLKFSKNFPVCQYDPSRKLVKVWENWSEAKKFLGVTLQFGRVKNKLCKGFIWKRLGEAS